MALRLRRAGRSIASRFSSSLTRRIVVLNLGGLVALLCGFLYLNQFRAGLIDARMQSLQTLSEVIAGAVAASATVEADTLTMDPEKLLQLIPGQSHQIGEESEPSLEFSINPERVGPVLRRLVTPTHTRGRIYDSDGYLLLDSASLATRSRILRSDLPPTDTSGQEPGWLRRLWETVRAHIGTTELPLYEEIGSGNGKAYSEVERALAGDPQSVVRINPRGETIISVAVPIQRFRVVRGALLLTTQGGDIDSIIASERWAILRIFVVSAGVMLLLSLSLAGTIAEPMRKLAEAADRVRRGTKSRQEIPDFTDRSDEIGHLSGALRDMTSALYKRMDAIESFAADVSHELKNPLTSLRSAVETLPIAKTDASKARLLEVIQHDVRRLDRLISDISDASRLDAELSRADAAPVDLALLLEAVVSVANGVHREDGVTITLDVAPIDSDDDTPAESDDGDDDEPVRDYRVVGHDSRLGQVVTNLIENARSFSPQGGNVRVALRRAPADESLGHIGEGSEIIVDDDGPGIPSHALERIFERFYTDRPSHGFGQNSGLGLSISRQIIEAHGGLIRAVNRSAPTRHFATAGDGPTETASSADVRDDALDADRRDDETGPVAGARFLIWLPSRR